MRAKQTIQGALVTAGCVLATLLAGRATGGAGGLILLPASLVLGGAIAGYVMVRSLGARWPEPVLASLTSTVGLIALFAAAMPEYSPFGGGAYPGASRDQLVGVLTMVAAGGIGSFAVPLADPGVRRTGPAPTLWKVAAIAAALVVALLIAQVVLQTGSGQAWSYLALGVFAGGAVFGAVAAGLGMVLTLLGFVRAGAWSGGLGLVTAVLSLIVWLAAGSPWFP